MVGGSGFLFLFFMVGGCGYCSGGWVCLFLVMGWWWRIHRRSLSLSLFLSLDQDAIMYIFLVFLIVLRVIIVCG